MNQNPKFLDKFLIFLFLGLLLILVEDHLVLSSQDVAYTPIISRQEILKVLPPSFQFCLPKGVVRASIFSIYEVDSYRYFLISLLYGKNSQVSVIFQATSTNCQALTPLAPQLGADSLLGYSIPQEIVLTLSFKKYQNLANQLGGIKPLERTMIEFNRSGSGHDEIYYPLEEFLAFEKLGLNIPPSPLIFIVAPEGIYGMNEAGKYELVKPFK